MGLRALFYAYVLGGFTCIPLLLAAAVFFSIYTSSPVGDPDPSKPKRGELEKRQYEESSLGDDEPTSPVPRNDVDDAPKPRKGWLTIRRTFEEPVGDGSYVGLVRSFLDSKSKDPKRARPKDMWFCVLKGKVLFLYEDEGMSECEGAIELGGHDVVVYPEGLPDGELFTKRNALCLKPKHTPESRLPSLTKEMKLERTDVDKVVEEHGGSEKKKALETKVLEDAENRKDSAREEAHNINTPWFIFVRSCVEMEDWYLSLVHASDNPPHHPTLEPLKHVFQTEDMNHLVHTLDEQPDVIPMRWLNALIGRILFSYYRTESLQMGIISRIMKKLSKVKLPAFLTNVVVTEVSVGNRAPTLSKPMLKELTKEGDAAMEVHVLFKGEFRITVEATANISLGTFRSYSVKLAMAVVLKELEGNLLVKVKRPPSNRIWYAFTQMPRIVMEVEPIVSDRQLTWGMILSTIESKIKEIIQESVVMPYMDDLAFFDSSDFSHRGGIWSDAARKERAPSTDAEPEQQPVVDETMSVASAPVDTRVQKPTEEASPVEALRSKSAEQVVIHAEPQPISALSAASEPGYTHSEPSSPPANKAARRKSWFSSTPIEGLPDQPEQDDGARGRAQNIDPQPSLRSRSTPNKSDSPTSLDPSEADCTPVESSFLTPQRTTSRTSGRGHSHSVSSDSAESTSTSSSSKMRDGQSASPTSFLTTLKTRAAAADKVAISNTAKEAMRKWGVNWGGFNKKDSMGSDDNTSDNGSLGSRLRLASDNMSGSASSKGRSSYAEVRAAVAERRERDGRHPAADDSASERGSSPVPIPDASDRDRARALSPSSGYGSSFEPGSAESSRSGPARPESSRKPSMTASERPRVVSGARTEPQPSTASPILIQPQARTMTMTIPGIHASHRGEVQSIENVAPPPTMEPKPKVINPAIQSMYRLWKSPHAKPMDFPSVSDDGSMDSTTSVPEMSLGNSSTEGQQATYPQTTRPSLTTQVTPPTPVLSSNPKHSSPPRGTPPALPPRTSLATVSKPSVHHSGSYPGGLTASSSGANGITASDALKSIANNFRADESHPASASDSDLPARGSHDGTPLVQGGTAPSRSGPPLPPRPSHSATDPVTPTV
ncbi:hypothetical protein BDV98DRAFT_139311 [Pterulicium gracile]|uniref:SMP-LTD domain-containing protein n=1 Tax=Pterulicium gracile TaxID=1884261 RepID=A0A5C3QVT5_9AGAR|nr:hypothetical protein BDV98DRAFT_139311 [Pterula gracilis]